MSEQVVTSLIGQVKVSADTKPLVDFEKRMDTVAAKLQKLTSLSDSHLKMKVSLDRDSLAEGIKAISGKRLLFQKVGLAAMAAVELSDQVKKIVEGARITLNHFNISKDAKDGIKSEFRTIFANTFVPVKLALDANRLNEQLKRKKDVLGKNLKFKATVGIDKKASKDKIRRQLESIEKQVGKLNVSAATLKLGVDKDHLIASIKAALHETYTIRVGAVTGRNAGGGMGATSALGYGAMGAAMGYGSKLGRGFLPGLGVAYSISQLNQMNQQLQANALAMQAVSGNGERFDPQQQINWFKQMSLSLGMDYRENMPAYTKMLATGTTSGYTVGETQNIYSGIAAYGRVMGLDAETMKGSMRA
jgi:hypothetical protein